MRLFRGRSVTPFISALFALLILQTTFWPLLVSSVTAFELLPHHTHIYLHPDAHTVHQYSVETVPDPGFHLAENTWSDRVMAGALCWLDLFAGLQMVLLVPAADNERAAATYTPHLFAAAALAEQLITPLFFPPPHQPPKL